jgi:hypothetical protein
MLKNLFSFILCLLAAIVIPIPVLLLTIPFLVVYFVGLCLFKLFTLFVKSDKVQQVYDKTEEFGFYICTIPFMGLAPIMELGERLEVFKRT